MPLIEGIGDEVLEFFGLVFVSLIGIIAWWSTGIRERPQIRTVLILEHRSPSGTTSQPAATQQSERRVPDNRPLDRVENENTDDDTVPLEQHDLENEVDVASDSALDKKLIKEKRLAYFQQTGDAALVEDSNTDNDTTRERSEGNGSSTSADNIRIRLKYLNDDQKLVEGRLQELLGDFKRRHFSGELSADKLVRLIFNGQVLQSDDKTLQGYGLYDNCVVHCLVHAQRSNMNRTSSQPQANAAPPECNLGFLLYTSVSIILGFAWFFRYHYSQLFTMTTTAGLVGLTAIFAVLIVGLYMPDQETLPTQ